MNSSAPRATPLAPALSPADPPPAPAAARRRRWLRRLVLGAGGLLLALLLVAATVALWFRGQLLGSAPALTGEAGLAGLSAPLTVERDRVGVATVSGADRLDVARGLGFVHAQDRFFQMDLTLRRRAAGETAALVGQRGLGHDQRVRIHQFRRRAERALEALPADQRALLTAYTQGVNAGLAALASPPFEYLLLRADPEPWRPEDSLLVLHAIFLELQQRTLDQEANLGFMRARLPPEVFDLLTPLGSEWDSPMIGPTYTTSDFAVIAGWPEELEGGSDSVPAEDGGEAHRAADLLHPDGSATITLAGAETRDRGHDGTGDPAGSNAWALAPRHTASGEAIVANDMHLPLSVPGIWYRTALRWSGANGVRHRLDGVTLPGFPLLVAGSNGRVAWGLTSSQIDTGDLVLLEVAPERPDHYLTPAGPRPFEAVEETIRVRGGAPVTVGLLLTSWGPVLPDDRLGQPVALSWLPYLEGAVDLGALALETASSVGEALAAARSSGAPPQNIVLADAHGSIAWSILGRVPARRGFSGRLPTSWADGSRRWEGLLPPDEVPAIVDPPSGMVWNGNNRSVDGEAYARLGDGGYRSGARARQIHGSLLELERATEEDMLAIQRDHRALFLERWHRLLMTEVLTPEAVAAEPRRATFGAALAEWRGAASVDSVSFGLVRLYRLLLAQEIFDHLTRELREVDPSFGLLRYPHFEQPLWRLVTEQPPELLDPSYPTWRHQLLAGVDATIDWLGRHGGGRPLEETTWGSLNVLAVRHPLSRAVPGLGRWLDMPAVPLPGAEEMPLAQRPDYGASVRLVVTPGREERGYLEIPMGQSGHPLSQHYADSFAAWVGRSDPTPLLPGEALHVLRLVPAGPLQP